MGYIERNLADGERIVYRTKVYPIIFVFPLLFVLLSLAGFWSGVSDLGHISLALVLVLTLYSVVAWSLSDYVLTNRRVMGRYLRGGLQHFPELTLLELRAVQFKPDILGRLFGYGTVVFTDRQGTRYNYRGASAKFYEQVQSRLARNARILN